MNKKLRVIIPIAVFLLVLLAGGIYSAQASGADFSVNGDRLVAYLGMDEEVTVPDEVRVIGEEAFAGNTSVKKVNLPKELTEIDYRAFNNCTALESISIPDSVVSMSDSVFDGCSALKDVTLGKSLQVLGRGCFAGCTSLKDVAIVSENTALKAEGGALYNSTKSTLFQVFAGNEQSSFTVPASVSNILRYSLWGNENIQELTVAGTEVLSDYCFARANGLESAVICAPAREIGRGAFSGCKNLKQIVVPVSVGKIYDNAFEECPADLLFVCEMGSAAERFALEHGYRVSTSSEYSVSDNRPASDTGAVSGNDAAQQQAAVSNDEAAAVDTTSENEAAEQNGNAENTVTADTAETQTLAKDTGHSGDSVLGDVRVVSDRAYVIADNMKVNDGSTAKVADTTANSGNGIGDHAHYLDQTLEFYDFSQDSGITYIGPFAFARTNITKAELPEGLKAIGEGAFYHCDRLSEVSIPSTVNAVGANAFSNTPWLEAWKQDPASGDFLIVGDGVLIAYKGTETSPELPAEVKTVADGVLP